MSTLVMLLVFAINAERTLGMSDPDYCKNLDHQSAEIVTPLSKEKRTVPCLGGWLIFQRRVFGNVSFQRNWEEYKTGFGEINGDFWLGLESLFEITHTWPMLLRIKMESWSGKTGEATFSKFEIMTEKDKYKLIKADNVTLRHLTMSAFGGHFGLDFSTNSPCAQKYTGGWWWGNCYHTNLNSRFPMDDERSRNCKKCMNWNYFDGEHPLKYSEMAIHRK
ncbi:ficolin-1-like [Scaptodrosophila lebanonensis]|uniref:Ficolin-1-like n=1 Tax=Drosophila lebanonensis TaxID=7225 RepID=A0A6J2TIU7_DROLE|nr:ficolin-1-like [Scaptodrosophila lebanonensis]